jgi:DNA recombination protein RmuC
MTEVLLVVISAAAGAAVAWMLLRVKLVRIPEMQAELESLRPLVAENAQLKARYDAEKRAWSDAEAKLADAFRAMSSEALRTNNEQFLQLAQTHLTGFQQGAQTDLDTRQKAIGDLVSPLRESLAEVQKKLHDLEVARTGAYSTLSEQVRSLADCQNLLRGETANLVKALRAPAARGRWGEIQLRRVVEMAGMLEYCDFCEQQTIQTPDGRLRPDLIVRLPNERRIVVDSKVPLAAYLEAHEAQDDGVRAAKLNDHARQVRTHLASLGERAYWTQFDAAPDFVVAFLPGESFFSAALQQDATLIEYGMERRVLIATPTTLIALLKAVAYGWRQENITKNAQEISRLGRDLYERVGTLAGHLAKVGSSLDRATQVYNQAVGTLETRVLVSARKLKEKGIDAQTEIPPVEPVERIARPITAPELTH